MEKHPNIPEAATWNEYAQHWIMGEFDTRLNLYVGELAKWDLDGELILKGIYDRETGNLVEERNYENGKLFSLEESTPDVVIQTFYYRDIVPLTVEKRILYRNKAKDQTTTYFDRQGRETCSVHFEIASHWNEREYFNGVLVYECILNDEETKAPVSVRYFYPGGTTMIDYTSNDDGTGWWQMYDEAGRELGKLPELEEHAKIKHRDWKLFSPDPDSYNEETVQPDWETIPLIFKQDQQLLILEEKIHNLEVPAHLQAELEKVDWTTTAMRNGEELPVAINGMLSTDEEIALRSYGRIWRHMYSASDATYKVPIVIGRMLPFYDHIPAVQLHLLRFLFGVFAMDNIKDRKELYDELVASLQPAIPLLSQLANNADEDTAQKARDIMQHLKNSDTYHKPDTHI
jgi:antitoxin component YwqK of YwqJK toxin-antitoxin module